jgi:hypothetical protein
VIAGDSELRARFVVGNETEVFNKAVTSMVKRGSGGQLVPNRSVIVFRALSLPSSPVFCNASYKASSASLNERCRKKKGKVSSAAQARC